MSVSTLQTLAILETEKKVKIFLVDDDAIFLRLVEIEFLQYTDFEVETYATGELCLQNLSRNPHVVVLDYHLDGIEKKAMTGLEVLDNIKLQFKDMPVVMLSSQYKIEIAVNCMHHKAFDYIVKSETAIIRLRKVITAILHYRKMDKLLTWYMDRA